MLQWCRQTDLHSARNRRTKSITDVMSVMHNMDMTYLKIVTSVMHYGHDNFKICHVRNALKHYGHDIFSVCHVRNALRTHYGHDAPLVFWSLYSSQTLNTAHSLFEGSLTHSKPKSLFSLKSDIPSRRYGAFRCITDMTLLVTPPKKGYFWDKFGHNGPKNWTIMKKVTTR